MMEGEELDGHSGIERHAFFEEYCQVLGNLTQIRMMRCNLDILRAQMGIGG